MARRPVNLRVPEGLWVRVQDAAGEAGVSVTEFVCERLEEVVGSGDGDGAVVGVDPVGVARDSSPPGDTDVQAAAGLESQVGGELVGEPVASPPPDEPVIARDLSDPEYAAAPGECPHPPEALRRFGNMVKCGVCRARVA